MGEKRAKKGDARKRNKTKCKQLASESTSTEELFR